MPVSLAVNPRPEVPPREGPVPVPDTQSEKEHVVITVAGLVRRCVILEDRLGYNSAKVKAAHQEKDDKLAAVLKVDPRLATEGVARGHGLEPQSVENEHPAVAQEALATAQRLSSGIMTPQEQGQAQAIVDAYNAARQPAADLHLASVH